MNWCLEKMQARNGLPLPCPTGANGPSMNWSTCAPHSPFWPMSTLLNLSSCTPMLVGLACGLSSTRSGTTGLMPGWDPLLVHKLQFLALTWAVVEKFHKYIYRSTFDIYTDNNPLTYVLTMAKLDPASHCWMASLASYNFQLYYREGGPTSMKMPCWGCPGPCVHPTLWAHTPNSLQPWC